MSNEGNNEMNIPTETLKTLTVGDIVNVNGRKTRYTVTTVCEHFVSLTGPRGGWKNLVPNIGGKTVYLTDVNNSVRVTELEKV